MTFNHADIIIKSYPQNYTGVLVLKNFSNYTKLSRSLEYFKNDIMSFDFIEKVKPVSDRWQKIFLNMGAKPKYKSSLTSLIDYFLEEKKLYKINPIVDLYNYYSLIKGFPMGAYDLDKLSETVSLDIVGKDKEFTPLGKPNIKEYTKEKEIAYFDQDKVICRYWNLQDCDQSKITQSTKNILFIFDIIALDGVNASNIFRGIAQDFKNIFCTYDENFSFTGITGSGLNSKLEF